MLQLADEIEQASATGLHSLAVCGALTLIDIATALEQKDGKTNGQRFADWFEAHCSRWSLPPGVSPNPMSPDLYALLNERQRAMVDPIEASEARLRAEGPRPYPAGADIYLLRCALLHQGRAEPHNPSKRTVDAVVFFPGSGIHNNLGGDATLQLSAPDFVGTILGAVRKQHATLKDTEPYKSNLARTLQERPGGAGGFLLPGLLG